jgi:hypothetical protein
VIRIPDGQLTVDGNSTFDDGAFDFACKDCGWHGPQFTKTGRCPDCGGIIAWHDDVDLIKAATRTQKIRAMPTEILRRLELLGSINTYGTLDKPPAEREVFVSLTQANWFTWSAMAQLAHRVSALEAA